MRTVGLRELKNKLSEYIRRVRSGELVLVTDRGEVVAEIRPPGQVADSVTDPGLATLIKQGLLDAAVANNPENYPILSPALKRSTSQKLLDAEREGP